MKILFITCWYPTEQKSNFGVFVHEHAKAIQQAGAEVKVAHIWPVKNNKRWFYPKFTQRKKDGIEIFSIQLESQLPGLWYNFWPALSGLATKVVENTIIDGWQPDMLHGHVVYPAGFITLRLSRKLNLPYQLTEHWSKLHWVFNRPVYRRVARKVFHSAGGIHPVSSHLAGQLKKYINESSKLEVIPNVVDDNLFHPGNKADHARHISLLCVTNFLSKKEVDKRPDLLIEALHKLDTKHREKFSLTFIGQGEQQERYKETVAGYELESRITFSGRQPKAYVAEKMREADFLVHPTEKETFGVVVAEALCSGLPCIVSNIPALRELVDGESGIVVENNTVERWTDCLRRVAAGEFKFSRRAITQKKGRQFSYETVGNAYLEAYRKTLKSGI